MLYVFVMHDFMVGRLSVQVFERRPFSVRRSKQYTDEVKVVAPDGRTFTITGDFIKDVGHIVVGAERVDVDRERGKVTVYACKDEYSYFAMRMLEL